MSLCRSVITATLIVISTPTSAQNAVERRYTSTYTNCLDESEGITSNMMDCIGAEIDVQDARLNQAYVMVMRPLAKPRKDVLRGLQRAWIKQRDAKCQRAVGEEEGGSIAGIIYSSCILDETISRTIFLEKYKG